MRRWMLVLALAGCSDDPSDDPPPEAVQSCSLVAKKNGNRSVLWFDASSRLVRFDNFVAASSGSFELEYDDQDRVVRTSTWSGLTTWWTYEPARITAVDSSGSTYVYELDNNGLVIHFEGPEEGPAAKRHWEDYEYDSEGRITAFTGGTRWSASEDGAMMTIAFWYQFTYDDQGRIATSNSDRNSGPISYAYIESPGHLTIDVTDSNGGKYLWTYDFDNAGRVVHAETANSRGYTTRAYSYAYVGDTITATNDGSADIAVTATGAPCPAVASTLTVDRPLTFNPLERNAGHSTLWMPNPPVEAFGGYGFRPF